MTDTITDKDIQKELVETLEKEVLISEELINLANCCVRMAKLPDVNNQEMKYLLNLADKLQRMK